MDNISELIQKGIQARHNHIDAYRDNLEKDAGDRGGKVVGTTASGKPKYEKKDQATTSMHSSNKDAHMEQVSRARKAYDKFKDSTDPKDKAAASKAKAFLDSAKKTKLSKSVDVVSDYLEKAKEMPVGTVSHGRKKMPNGSWVPVKDSKGGGKENKQLKEFKSEYNGAENKGTYIEKLKEKIKKIESNNSAKDDYGKELLAAAKTVVSEHDNSEAADKKELADLNKKDKDNVDKKRKEGKSLADIAGEQKASSKSESAADKAMRESKTDSVSERESKAVAKIKMMASASSGGKLGPVNTGTGMVKTFAKMYNLSPKRVVELAEKHGGAKHSPENPLPKKEVAQNIKNAVAQDVKDYTSKRGMSEVDAMKKVKSVYEADIKAGHIMKDDIQGYKDAISHLESEIAKKDMSDKSADENKKLKKRKEDVKEFLKYNPKHTEASANKYMDEMEAKFAPINKINAQIDHSNKNPQDLDYNGKEITYIPYDKSFQTGDVIHKNLEAAMKHLDAGKETDGMTIGKLGQKMRKVEKSTDQSIDEAFDILEKGNMTAGNIHAKSPKADVKKKLDKMFDPENEKDIDNISKSEDEDSEGDEMEKSISDAYALLIK